MAARNSASMAGASSRKVSTRSAANSSPTLRRSSANVGRSITERCTAGPLAWLHGVERSDEGCPGRSVARKRDLENRRVHLQIAPPEFLSAGILHVECGHVAFRGLVQIQRAKAQRSHGRGRIADLELDVVFRS